MVGNAKATGLPDGCCDVVVNEAMLTMNTDRSKDEIVAEASRILRIGRNYLRDAAARRRVNDMWRTFRRYRRSVGAVAVVAQQVSRPAAD